MRSVYEKNPNERYQTFRELRRELGLFYRDMINEELPSPPKPVELEACEFSNKGLSLANLGLLDEAISEKIIKGDIVYGDMVEIGVEDGKIAIKKADMKSRPREK